MEDKYSNYRIETRFIHSGQQPDPTTGAVVIPITLSTTFYQRSPGVYYSSYEYSRSGNPNREAFEKCMAGAENAKYALSFGTCTVAATTIFGMYRPGDHIIISKELYGGFRILFSQIISFSQNLDFSVIDTSDFEAVKSAIKSTTKLIWLEILTNPTLQLSDIHSISLLAKENQIKVLVDNTFATPYCASPLTFGADIVLHSVTKYIAGHSDVVMGVLVTNDENTYKTLKFLQYNMGGTPSPFDCYNAIKGLKTLHLRMKVHSENALRVAQFLESHPKVEKTLYPGLPSHPQHELAKKQLRMFSGIVTFYIKGGVEAARTFLCSVKVFSLAESLGAVESLVKHPGLMTHAFDTEEVRRELGVSDTLIRLSVGVEYIDDLLEDLEQALEKVVAS